MVFSEQSALLRRYLFPNMTKFREDLANGELETVHASRALLKRPTSSSPLCLKCHNLNYCRIINGYMIEEVYIPAEYAIASEVNSKGTCTVIEALGKRMSNEIFGEGKTFRDNSQCREMVMQYLCLFYSSNNPMYTNSCFYHEDVSSPDPTLHLLTTRPPCRSFCVQV